MFASVTCTAGQRRRIGHGRETIGGDVLEAGFGRKLRGLKTTSTDLPDYVERVVRRWPSLARGAESMVMASAGHTASHSLQAMQRSSPFG